MDVMGQDGIKKACSDGFKDGCMEDGCNTKPFKNAMPIVATS
jgi:hypothetical protein